MKRCRGAPRVPASGRRARTRPAANVDQAEVEGVGSLAIRSRSGRSGDRGSRGWCPAMPPPPCGPRRRSAPRGGVSARATDSSTLPLSWRPTGAGTSTSPIRATTASRSSMRAVPSSTRGGNSARATDSSTLPLAWRPTGAGTSTSRIRRTTASRSSPAREHRGGGGVRGGGEPASRAPAWLGPSREALADGAARAVDRHERTLPPRALVVDRPRHQPRRHGWGLYLHVLCDLYVLCGGPRSPSLCAGPPAEWRHFQPGHLHDRIIRHLWHPGVGRERDLGQRTGGGESWSCYVRDTSTPDGPIARHNVAACFQ